MVSGFPQEVRKETRRTTVFVSFGQKEMIPCITNGKEMKCDSEEQNNDSD